MRQFHNKCNFIFLCLFFTFFSLSAEEFKYQFKKDDIYRLLTTINEDVFLNGNKNHTTEIVNRISVEITEVDETGTGKHKASHMVSETALFANGTQNQFSWGEEYQTEYSRDVYGFFDIAKTYFVPVVRNVPVFPKENVEIGDTWTANGSEVHDLRKNFSIEEPYEVPFLVRYTYKGIDTSVNPPLHIIQADYSMYYENPKIDNTTNTPISTMGYSTQTLYWNNENGTLDHYTERFRIVMETSLGDRIEYRGTSKTEITELIRISTEEKVSEVQQKITDLGIKDTTVKAVDKGISISLERIQFLADSAILLDSEKAKLDMIAQILAEFPDNDLLITGHTARAGTVESQIILSKERAASVAEYLLSIGVKDPYHIFTKGVGSGQPIATNANEEGKSRNRRVEITILDK